MDDSKKRERANENARYRKAHRKQKWRYALVPKGLAACKDCAMYASRGFVYWQKFVPHDNCDCNFEKGIPGETVIEGYDPDAFLRVWQRQVNAQESEKIVCPSAKSEILKELQELERSFSEAWRAYSREGTLAAYREYVAKYVEALSPDGLLSIDDYAKPEPKEIQIALWKAQGGCKVHLRNANDYKDLADGNTSDALVDEVLCDFKRITSANRKKVSARVFEHINNQGPHFVIDLSLSPIEMEDALAEAAAALEHPRVSRVSIVKDGIEMVVDK